MSPLVIALYVAINVIVFLFYGADKVKAKADWWRVPESTLLLLALIGPFGATLGMLLFHHKTSKPKFKLVYLFLVIHVILIIYLITKGY